MHALLVAVLLSAPPVTFTADAGVPAPLAERVGATARAGVAFLARDLGLDAAAGGDAIAVTLGPDAGGRNRPGVTRADGVRLNARYFLAGKKGARTQAAALRKATEVTVHELTHALANRASRKNMPLWFSEGLAQHEAERYLRTVDPAGAAAFERRRLAPALRGDPIPLDDLDFGKTERRRFYGPDHALHYSAGYAAVRAIAGRFGDRALGALLIASGRGLPCNAKIAERRLRWKRAVREVLGVEPAMLDSLRDEWLAGSPLQRDESGAAFRRRRAGH